MKIVDGILQRVRVGTQQQGKGLREHHHQDGDGRADYREGHQILRKEPVSALRIPLPQEIGNDGGGTHGKNHCDGEQQVDKRHGQVHSAHGIFTNATGHEQAVHNRVQGENHEGGHRGRGESDKLLE